MNSKRAHTVAIHQPAYLPWLGYFERIFRSDVFVFLDSVQFEKNSFTNRNKIKTAHGEQWLTVPVKAKGHTELSIAELGIADGEPWQKKHLKAIQLNYAKARYFSELFPKLEALYASKATTLADLCFNQLRFWLGELQIEREIIRSSTMTLEKKKSALV
ncbi:MAG: WbqC family protein, partial [Bdellovibrionales bacterium]|nr:WbqC family protein [Bdellovibrionales bacterium]